MTDVPQNKLTHFKRVDWLKWGLIFTGVLLSILFLVVPILWIFITAFSKGFEIFTENLFDNDMLHALGLTVLIAVIAVPINMLFGIAVAWLVTRFHFFWTPLVNDLD